MGGGVVWPLVEGGGAGRPTAGAGCPGDDKRGEGSLYLPQPDARVPARQTRLRVRGTLMAIYLRCSRLTLLRIRPARHRRVEAGVVGFTPQQHQRAQPTRIESISSTRRRALPGANMGVPRRTQHGRDLHRAAAPARNCTNLRRLRTWRLVRRRQS
jgi:hypothetical protein